MFGYLDGISNGEIYGWALDPADPERPVRITVSINGLPACEALAIHYRPDVGAAHNCRGLNGFYIDLTEFAPGKRVAIRVTLPDGRDVTNSPAMMDIPARPPWKGDHLLFMHIPRTAGTAVREAIAENYLPSQTAYLYVDPPGLPGGDLRILPLEQRRRLRCILGHFRFGIHITLPRPSTYVTLVRDPVARVISYYRHLVWAAPQAISEGDQLLSLEQALEHRVTAELDNLMVRYFAGVDDQKFPAGCLMREHWEAAVGNLHSHFRFVGHQEDAQASFDRLAALFGCRSRVLEPRMAGRGAGSFKDAGDIDKIVRHFNHWDIKLYEEIMRKFPRALLVQSAGS